MTTSRVPELRAHDESILWQTDLAKRFRVNRITIYKWEQSGLLPPPDVVLGRRRGRYESTIRSFERSTLSASNAA